MKDYEYQMSQLRLGESAGSFMGSATIAAKRLGNAKAKGAIDALISALGQRAEELQEAAREALVKIGGQQTVVGLASLLHDHIDAATRFHSAVALVRLAKGRSIDYLGPALVDSDPRVACVAAGGLLQVGDNRGLDLLHAHLSDTNAGIRLAAATALANVNDGSGLKLLEQDIRPDPKDDFFSRRNLDAVRMISALPTKYTRELLIRALSNPGIDTRYAAADGLRRLGGMRARLAVLRFEILIEVERLRLKEKVAKAKAQDVRRLGD